MPKGIPRIGSHVSVGPSPEVLGVVPAEAPVLDPTPQGPQTQWGTVDGGTMAIDEGPPPWELEGGAFEQSDARRYVQVPAEWTLRWINPRLLDSQGWRYWKPVMASDPRVTVLVTQMIAPDNNIRRGGGTGDILAYMPTTWVVSRRKQLADQTARQTASAVDRQQELREQFRQTGGLIRMEESRHPTHTLADGRSLTDP